MYLLGIQLRAALPASGLCTLDRILDGGCLLRHPGDCGQVGRGNKVNGVISLNRPMSTEAAAGKNPVSHVGKIYTLLSHRMAADIHASVPGLHEVYVWLGSQIGKPIDQPLIASVQLILQQGVALRDVTREVERVVQREFETIGDFTTKLAAGELPVW